MLVLILTDDGSLIAARDRLGRTPIVIGKKDGAVRQPRAKAARSRISTTKPTVSSAPAKSCVCILTG